MKKRSVAKAFYAPSEEQQQIIDDVVLGKNVVVDAVPGSGKTTTIFGCLHALAQDPVTAESTSLIVTYNRQLMEDTKAKQKKSLQDGIALAPVEIQTIHGLATKLYRHCFDDTTLRDIVRENHPLRPDRPPLVFDRVFFDETQDVRELLFTFFVKVVVDHGMPVQLIFLGDQQQTIYQFRGADHRYLTLFQDVWHGFPLLAQPTAFSKRELSQTFRLTGNMCAFLNQCVYGYERIRTNNPPGKPVRYVHSGDEREVVNYLLKQLENYKAEDILILAPSINTLLLKRLENTLVAREKLVYVARHEYDDPDPRVIKGKIRMQTYHSSKGREAKLTIVLAVDESYYTFYDPSGARHLVPFPMFVALTRSFDLLIAVHLVNYRKSKEAEEGPNRDGFLDALRLRFHPPDGVLRSTELDFIEPAFAQTPPLYVNPPYRSTTEKELTDNELLPMAPRQPPLIVQCHNDVSKLVKFVEDLILGEIVPHIDALLELEQGVDDIIDIDSDIPIPFTDRYEPVSDINGVAIPALYSDYLLHKYRKQDDQDDQDEDEDDDQDDQDDADGNETTKARRRSLYDQVGDDLATTKVKNSHQLRQRYNEIETTPDGTFRTQDYLFLANARLFADSAFVHRTVQIPDYHWVSCDQRAQCLARLDALFAKEACDDGKVTSDALLFEHRLCTKEKDKQTQQRDTANSFETMLQPFFDLPLSVSFSAILDVFAPAKQDSCPHSSPCLYELKFTGELTTEHKLQLLVYCWIYGVLFPDEQSTFRAKLFNIKTNQCFALRFTEDRMERLTFIVMQLIVNRSGIQRQNDPRTLDDTKFVATRRQLLQDALHANRKKDEQEDEEEQ